jgi:hypothetical protein
MISGHLAVFVAVQVRLCVSPGICTNADTVLAGMCGIVVTKYTTVHEYCMHIFACMYTS